MSSMEGREKEEESGDTAPCAGSAGRQCPSAEGLGKVSCPPGQTPSSSGPGKWHRSQQEAEVP